MTCAQTTSPCRTHPGNLGRSQADHPREVTVDTPNEAVRRFMHSLLNETGSTMTRPYHASTDEPRENGGRAQPPDDFDVAELLDGFAAFLGGTANVIMQLSTPPVGYGVVESTVDSGKVMLHPIKRLRTTV